MHPESGEEPPAEHQAMGGALWNSVQANKSLSRQESRKSMQRQESRTHVAEPYTGKTNWKDSLRGAGSRKSRQEDGSMRRSAPRQESPRRWHSGHSFIHVPGAAVAPALRIDPSELSHRRGRCSPGQRAVSARPHRPLPAPAPPPHQSLTW